MDPRPAGSSIHLDLRWHHREPTQHRRRPAPRHGSRAVSVPETAEALELVQAFDTAVAALLSETALLEAARSDEPLNEQLLAELDALGWVGLAIPEELGGVGL